MLTGTETTFWLKIYSSGPIEQAKQILRADFQRDSLCVTIEPTQFVYKGGEETGFVIGLINYPRYPSRPQEITARGLDLARRLLEGLYQDHILIMTPEQTHWLSRTPNRLTELPKENAVPEIDALSPDEVKLLEAHRKRKETQGQSSAHQIHALKVAARYSIWLDKEGRGTSFSTFVDEFGYESSDCKQVYEKVLKIREAAL